MISTGRFPTRLHSTIFPVVPQSVSSEDYESRLAAGIADRRFIY